MEYYFSGRYEHQLDAKRRIRIPAKMKAHLGDGYCICVGNDGCLRIMPTEATQELRRQLSALDMSDKNARITKHLVLESMCYPEEDPQGRIVLPKDLIQYAGIDKELLFVGVGEYVELWSAERYEEYKKSIEEIDISQYLKF